jgi:hypothetical protein
MIQLVLINIRSINASNTIIIKTHTLATATQIFKFNILFLILSTAKIKERYNKIYVNNINY